MHSRDLVNGTVESVEAALVQFLGEKVIPTIKLHGFGCVRAAVIAGRLTEVATYLKRYTPRMIAVHYANYRLALIAVHAEDRMMIQNTYISPYDK